MHGEYRGWELWVRQIGDMQFEGEGRLKFPRPGVRDIQTERTDEQETWDSLIQSVDEFWNGNPGGE